MIPVVGTLGRCRALSEANRLPNVGQTDYMSGQQPCWNSGLAPDAAPLKLTNSCVKIQLSLRYQTIGLFSPAPRCQRRAASGCFFLAVARSGLRGSLAGAGCGRAKQVLAQPGWK